MLIELRIANFKSIKDELVLSLSASGRGQASDDGRPRAVKGHAAKLLPAIALYGANASGKTNVLAALAYMAEAVLYSHRAWAPDGGTSREPFAWGERANEPSLFEVMIVLKGVRYQYGFLVDDTQFLEEWLHVWPATRKQVWFVRESDSFKFGENLAGENRLVEQVTRKNALFLSSAVQLRHEQLAPIYEWFAQLRFHNLGRRKLTVPPHRLDYWLLKFIAPIHDELQQALFEDNSDETSLRKSFIDLLRAADVGVVDIKVEARSGEPSAYGNRATPPVQVYLRHQNEDPEAWLPLEKESQGTVTLFRLGRDLLLTLRRGGTLVVDELEKSLHPLLALWIVNRFNNPETNPNNAQLMFSTHDTTLLGTTLSDSELRRDQVWLTEKGVNGATILFPLTDYKARKRENLERGYLQGRYGAVPIFGEIDVEVD